MPFFVYIIQSQFDNSFYKGFSINPAARLIQHNQKESKYTANKTPWTLVYVEQLLSKKEAIIRERTIKKYNRAQIEALILSNNNIVNTIR